MQITLALPTSTDHFPCPPSFLESHLAKKACFDGSFHARTVTTVDNEQVFNFAERCFKHPRTNISQSITAPSGPAWQTVCGVVLIKNGSMMHYASDVPFRCKIFYLRLILDLLTLTANELLWFEITKLTLPESGIWRSNINRIPFVWKETIFVIKPPTLQ